MTREQYRNGTKHVVRCPVCNGHGTLPYGFYHDQPRDATDAGLTTQCRSCMGRGIVE